MVTYDQGKTLVLYKELFTLCKEFGIKNLKIEGMEVEFYMEQPKPMSLAPQDLAKVLGDSIPPDSEMLFASTEDIEKLEIPNQ